jgi:hypothetical protein
MLWEYLQQQQSTSNSCYLLNLPGIQAYSQLPAAGAPDHCARNACTQGLHVCAAANKYLATLQLLLLHNYLHCPSAAASALLPVLPAALPALPHLLARTCCAPQLPPGHNPGSACRLQQPAHSVKQRKEQQQQQQ